MKRFHCVEPVDPARVRRIQGSFSWIDHRFIPLMEGLARDENLLYLWLVAVGDRLGLSFYSGEKTASRLKITVSEIAKARTGLIEKNLIAYRDGLSQVLSLPNGGGEVFHGGNHVTERESHATDQVSEGCRKSVVPADGEKSRALSKRIIKDILRQLEGAQNTAGISARRAS